MTISIKLFLVLIALLLTNQLLGTAYGSWKDKFNRDYFLTGLGKILRLCCCYGAVTLAAKFAGDYVPNSEYLSGILLEPIAKYYSKICKSMRDLLNDSVQVVYKSKTNEQGKEDKPDNPERTLYPEQRTATSQTLKSQVNNSSTHTETTQRNDLFSLAIKVGLSGIFAGFGILFAVAIIVYWSNLWLGGLRNVMVIMMLLSSVLLVLLGIDIWNEKDRNYLVSMFSSLVALVALAIAIFD